MSPSSAEWRLGLAPGHCEAMRADWRGRLSAPWRAAAAPPAAGEPAWQGALAAFDAVLDEAGAKRGSAAVVLSNHFVRYLVLPWQPAINRARELAELARLRFQAVYGDAAAGWTLRCSEGGWGEPSLACAVDTALVDAVGERLSVHGLRLATLQPLLMAAFNGRRRALGAGSALAVVEPGRVCVGLLSRGGFDAVSSRRTGDDAALAVEQELATLQPGRDEPALHLLRIGDAAPWPAGARAPAREWDARPLAACGVA